MADDGIITMAMVVLFVLGVLWSGWISGVKQWISGKVNET